MGNESLIILRDFSTLVQFVAALIASLFFYKYRNSFLKYFLVYLWITFIFEITAFLLRKYDIVNNNSAIYNVYSVLSFFYLFSIFIKAIHDQQKKNILKAACLLYFIILVAAGFYENYLLEPQIISYVFAELILILGIGFYLVEILKSEKALYANKTLLFWISLGLLLFSVGTIPFTIVMSYYTLLEASIHRVFAINFILIIIQNICFIIGFIKADKNQIV